MKKLILTCLIVSVFFQAKCLAWEWESFGPPGIKANKLCFLKYNSINAIICMDTGMFIIDDSGMGYEFYSYAGMKVVEAVSAGFGFDSDSIFLVMSDGSWSDGIYFFPVDQEQFVPLHYCYHPHFILKTSDKYFVGYDNGLLISEDGITWGDIPFFNGIACIDMATNNEDFVVATSEDFNNTYLSAGDFNTWNQLDGAHITEFSDCNWYNIDIFGISEANSNDCGFYRLDDYWSGWYNIFYSTNLNAVGLDNSGNPFVGWYQGIPPQVGIAQCYPVLTLLNDGLPNLNIHAISAPFIVGATVVYCCTDSGIYSRVLSVGESENKVNSKISIYPNPSVDQAFILIKLLNFPENILDISFYNTTGLKVDELKPEVGAMNELHFTWNKGNLPAGVYFLVVRIKNETMTEKFIIL